LNPTGTQPNGVDNAGGSGVFPLPMITLNDNQAYSIANSFDNYTEAHNRMVIGNASGISVDSSKTCNTGGIVATGSTDIGDAMQEAIRQLNPSTGLTRPNATRAIVIFTDGCPNIDYNVVPPSSSFDTCKADCVSQATIAHGMNPPINIYSIGLALDPSLQAKQTDLLTNITNAANGGPSGQSQYKQITDSSEIEKAFQTIAKNLVVITK
jgi:hypothetical protein